MPATEIILAELIVALACRLKTVADETAQDCMGGGLMPQPDADLREKCKKWLTAISADGA
ncbi:hypothetical protein [Acinetobacter sp. WCHAc010034]|uniref:hypothetical protein n=1 Tax=Acinetobacter sp. WCHAc010034 TaxID=1879049 RepID=UPI0013C33B58|nr:hypothetical protein [Acinetobacter sp. WCHAc010034]